MSNINYAVSIKTAIAIAAACPGLAYSFVGAPGCGKTFATKAEFESAPKTFATKAEFEFAPKTFATKAELEARGYHVMLFSCQNIPIEDLAQLPIVDTKTGTATFAANAKWKPMPSGNVIILDELMKAPEDVFNAFNSLLYGKPRTFMGYEYPEDTIVIVTGNSAVFGAGDNLRPHHTNRMVNLTISDPTTDEALIVMTRLGFDARIIEWVQAVPRALVSYDPAMQSAKVRADRLQTYFGYSESAPNAPFCSMRSLDQASVLLKASDRLPAGGLHPALIGTIGVNAALSLVSFADGIAEFVTPAEIEKTPDTARVPKSPFDQRLAATTAAAIINTKNYAAVLRYVDRLHVDIRDNVFTPRLVHADGALRVVPAIAKRMAAVL